MNRQPQRSRVSPRLGNWPSRVARTIRLLLAACSAATVVPAAAELRVSQESIEGGQRTTYSMTVSPAAQPVPALKYSLTLGEFERKPGDAAPFYYRAMLTSPQTIKGLRDKHGEEYDKWIDLKTPLGDLPLDKVREVAEAYGQQTILGNLREAARRSECNWSWQLQTLPGLESISFLLPEMQATRDLSSALILRIRLAIAEGRYQDAIDELRINYQMARDVANEPILISGLVGIAEASLGNAAVIELMAAKNSPNLYWALAELPRPLVDLRRAARYEMSWGFNLFPVLRDAETTEHSPQEWARLLGEAFSQVGMISGDGMPHWNKIGGQISATAVALVSYPNAKQRLIDAGMDADKVENMPVGQVLTIDAAREYHALADELVKWMYVPYTVVRQRNEPNPFQKQGVHGPAAIARGYGYVLGSLLLPALENARAAAVRFEWQLNALMAVEAIRMHAAETGKLPAKLDDVRIVPVLDNPATGEPYEYRLDGDTAILDLPLSDGFSGVAWRFEIKLAK